MMAVKSQVAERIMVALDYSYAGQAEALVQSLEGIPCYMKVGMQLFYSAGPQFVTMLKEKGYRVFLDLKMHDIPNTVKGGAESVTKLGVDMFNVHAAGGKEMMEAAMEGVDKGFQSDNAQRKRPIVIGVTQLTSTSESMMNEQIGIAGTLEEAVLRYAGLAQSAGLGGVVASPLEVVRIKQACGRQFVTVTPGIRPAGADIGDQSRVMMPDQAFSQGTDYIVIGRPITSAPDPRQAFESIIASVKSVNESE